MSWLRVSFLGNERFDFHGQVLANAMFRPFAYQLQFLNTEAKFVISIRWTTDPSRISCFRDSLALQRDCAI